MEGGCLCGAIRYRISGAPHRTTNCHCLHCRRSSGAPFLTWIEVCAAEPEDHIGCDRRAPWLKFADGLPRYGLRKSGS